MLEQSEWIAQSKTHTGELFPQLMKQKRKKKEKREIERKKRESILMSQLQLIAFNDEIKRDSRSRLEWNGVQQSKQEEISELQKRKTKLRIRTLPIKNHF